MPQAFIFIVKTIFASGTYRELLKESAAKKVLRLLSEGKVSKAKKLAKKLLSEGIILEAKNWQKWSNSTKFNWPS